jgi:hypothetical protein
MTIRDLLFSPNYANRQTFIASAGLRPVVQRNERRTMKLGCSESASPGQGHVKRPAATVNDQPWDRA